MLCRSLKLQDLIDRLNLVSREILTGIPVIRAFSREKHEEERFEEANQRLTKTNLFVNRTMTFMMPLMMLIMNGISVLIIYTGAHSIDAGNMQVGDMMAFIQYAMQIIMSFLMITMMSIMLPRAGVAANRILEVLDIPLSIEDPENCVKPEEKEKGTVVFDHVSFAYPGAEEEVLSDITFEARKGETVAFIGSTGSGKSTLVNLIPRFFDVTKGKCRVDGVDIRQMKLGDLRERIGYVPQKVCCFPAPSILILLWKRECDQRRTGEGSSHCSGNRVYRAERRRYGKPDRTGRKQCVRWSETEAVDCKSHCKTAGNLYF